MQLLQSEALTVASEGAWDMPEALKRKFDSLQVTFLHHRRQWNRMYWIQDPKDLIK